MATFNQKKRGFSISCHGGLKHAAQYLVLWDIKDFDHSLDIVLVSIDLEVLDLYSLSLNFYIAGAY
jgi:hypothetical protein